MSAATASTLFPASATRGADNALVRFKAGKLNHTKLPGENRYKVTADRTKGYLFMERDVSGLMHLKWSERDSSHVAAQDDHVLIPGDQTFEKVDTGVASDRVYLLQYSGIERRFFFWMQEPDATKDAENVRKLKERMGGSSTSTDSSAPMSDLQAILASMAGQNSSSSSNTTASTPATNAGGVDNAALLAAMQQAMSGVVSQPQGPPAMAVSLNNVVRHPDVQACLQSEEARRELIPHLPDGLQTTEELNGSLRTPQVQQAVSRLNGALQSSNINTVMVNFNLDPAAGAEHLARGDGVGAFISAVVAQQQQGGTSEENSTTTSEKKEGGDA
eukprot:g2715.t1